MKIKQIVEEHDIKWLDLEPVLSLPGQKKINPENIFPLDGHLNAAGHALVADALASRLNELL
jgi:lysophospholipase L1-like esterase